MPISDITFSSIPTTCFSTERPAYFHSGEKPADKNEPLDRFIRILSRTVKNDEFTFMVDGKPCMAHPKWLRDHVHEMKAFKHWDHDLKEYLDFIIKHQNEKGFFYEMVQDNNDYHCKIMPEEFMLHLPESKLTFVRLEVETDIEYLVVEGAVTVYKATGDEKWIKSILPALEKGINYMTSDEKRWSKEYGVIKRGFTIDTWDFMDTIKDIRYLSNDTPMSVMHGDNSGVYQAMLQLCWLNERFGNTKKATEWKTRAAKLKANVDKLCWNGSFYTHQVHLNHKGIDSNEDIRLSLSNTYDMNRKFTTAEQAKSIINEYKQRRSNDNYFAEWFTIDPPYKKFRSYEAGSYINGAISSLTAGELAKAAFEHNEEAYAWDIIKRLIKSVEENGELFFMYNPKTAENAGGGPSGWGAAAVLSAIEEGLFGIVDNGVCFDKMSFSPSVAVTDYNEIKYITGYKVSHTFIEMYYIREQNCETYTLYCPSDEINCHILVSNGFIPQAIFVNGKNIAFNTVHSGNSTYVDFDIICSNNTKRNFKKYTKQRKIIIEIL